MYKPIVSAHGEKGDKMEKLISTDALEGGKFRSIEDWAPIEASSWQRGWNDAIDAIISNVSTVDAPEVVRCKDCVNCSECITDDGMYIYIRCLRNGATICENDFCSWGERRENETD